MARLKLDMPEKFEFTTKIPVRITDINYGNHLGNDSFLSLIHEARVRYLNNINLTELNIDRYRILMVDSIIIYKSEVFYGDELIFNIAVTDISNTGCDFYYQVTGHNNPGEVALAKTGMVFYDNLKRKISAVPKIFIERVEKLKAR